MEPIASGALLESGTSGNLPGEGMAMFVMSSSPHEATTPNVVDVDLAYHLETNELHGMVDRLLDKHGLDRLAIDVVVLLKIIDI